MAVSNSIKIKQGNSTNDITLIKYKHGNTVDLIKAVWYVNNGTNYLIWPKDYDAVLTVTRVDNNSYNILASGATIELKWSLIVYYPNTNVVAYQDDDVTNSIYGSSNWLMVYNSKTNSYEFPGTTNRQYITIPNRGTNNNTLSSDGPWTFSVVGTVDYTLNGITYNISSASTDIATQSKNDYSLVNTRYTDIDILVYKDYRHSQLNNSSPAGIASYTSCTLYATVEGDVEETYTYTSGSNYIKTYTDDDPRNYIWEHDSANWINMSTTSRDCEITLNANSDTTSDRHKDVWARVTNSLGGTNSNYYTIYQSAAPEPDPNSSS